MRRLLTVLVLVLAGALAAPATPALAAPAPGPAGIGDPYWPVDGNGGIDVLHYGVHTSYVFDTGRLSGRTVVTLRARRDLSRFNLDLLLGVRAVRVDGVRAAWTKPRRHELQITPRRPLVAGRTYRVVVEYGGRPGPIEYAGERNWLADAHEVVTVNQPHMAPWWFPANDHPRDKARFDLHVNVPRSKTVIAGGNRVGSRPVAGGRKVVHWRSQAPMTTYLAFFAAGDFAVRTGTYQGRPWLNAVSERLTPEARAAAFRRLARSAPITGWLERKFGRYPFGSTGGLVTALPLGFALENQTRPIYPASWGGPSDELLVHELAHQWFGNSVALARWRDIWLNEGIASWAEWHWAETHGGESAAARLRREYDHSFDREYRVKLGHPGPEHVFAWQVYLHGPMALQALRNRVGEQDFWTLLRSWVRNRAHANGTLPQFQQLAERVSGEDLDGFFQAWFRAGRKPADTVANGLG